MHAFKGLIVSRADFIDNDGGRSRHRFEQAFYVPKSDVPNLKIELRRLGTTLQAWIDEGFIPMKADPTHATEAWIGVVEYDEQTANVKVDQIALLSITGAWERVRGPASDPDFQQRFSEAQGRLDLAMAHKLPGAR